MLDPVLLLLDDLYRTDEAHVHLQPLVTRCLRTAATAIGIQRLLEVLPLHLDRLGPPRAG